MCTSNCLQDICFNSKLWDICFNSKLRYVLKLYGNFTGFFAFYFQVFPIQSPVAIYETEPSTGDFSAMQRCVEEALTEAGGFQGYDISGALIFYIS